MSKKTKKEDPYSGISGYAEKRIFHLKSNSVPFL